MLAKTYTATHIGLEPLKIEVEVDGNRGTPSFILIGLASKATDEAKERITSALQNCGIRIRSKRTIVNLAPAEVPKTGAHFDLAIAVGLLRMYGEVSQQTDDTLFLGELSLDGRVKKIAGALPLIIAAKKWGVKRVVFPAENIPEVEVVSGIRLHPISFLHQYISYGKGRTTLPSAKPRDFDSLLKSDFSQKESIFTNFNSIHGQTQAKRALVIAAAGNHHVLLQGPPGNGKTLLAQAFPSILPPLTEQEALEVTQIYSVSHQIQGGIMTHRPFRSPHHTASAVGLLGGGAKLKPGELSLAHRGVLFLDELLEFPRQHLEALRQPLEDKEIHFSRNTGSIKYPCNFMLIAAANPCPCGYKDSQTKVCSCSLHMIERYREKLSGPIMDRFDMRIFVPEVSLSAISAQHNATPSSAELQQQVISARKRQAERYSGTPYFTNGDIPSSVTRKYISLTKEAEKILAKAAVTLKLSARSYFKIMKISQTICDLDEYPKDIWLIQEKHITEALQYR